MEQFKTFGRYTFDGSKYTFYNGGSGLSFCVSAKSVRVSVTPKPKNSYYYVIIDKKYDNKMKFNGKNPVFSIGFNDFEQHYIDIIKANESNDSQLEISGIQIDGGLLNYDFDHKYKVKAYGDSTVAGYGILAHKGVPNRDTCDSVSDFFFKALYQLGYDFDIFSASGWGLVFSDYTEPKTVGIIDYKDKLCVHSDVEFKDKNKADLLIISLGTNDYSYIKLEDSKNREERFKQAYKQLIDDELKNNKDMKILMVYGTLKEENVYPLIESTYEYLKPLYPNLYIHKFDGDNSGQENHAYVLKHNKMAIELKKVIKEIMQK